LKLEYECKVQALVGTVCNCFRSSADTHDFFLLGCCAGLQQFKQAALAYVLLAAAERPLDAGQVAAAAEAVLQQRLQLQVCFNAEEALAELRRFGLLVEQQQQQQQGLTLGALEQQQQQQGESGHGMDTAAAGASRRPAAAVVGASSLAPSSAAVAGHAAGAQQQQQQQTVLYRVLDSREAQQVLQQYWAGLLRQRVRSILRDV
jgi:hypothetical protein